MSGGEGPRVGVRNLAQEANTILLARRGMFAIGLALAAWLAQPGLPNAEQILLKVPLSGGQEVPPVFPAGAGTADIGYDPTTRIVTSTVTYRALSSAVTKAQFHGPAQPGKNAQAVLQE
jgi:hypothetical protein